MKPKKWWFGPSLFLLVNSTCLSWSQGPGLAEQVKFLGETLEEEEAMVIYELEDSVLSILAIKRSSFLCADLSLNRLFWKCLEDFMFKIRNADCEDFSASSDVVSLFLLDPVHGFIRGQKRVVIVPDKVLAELPFEALPLVEPPGQDKKTVSDRYLITEFEVTYRRDYMSRLKWAKAMAIPAFRSDESKFDFVGFAPGTDGNDDYSDLPDALREVSAIGSLFRNYGYSAWLAGGSYSEKGSFKKMAGKGRIIHLATHHVTGPSRDGKEGFLFRSGDSSCRRIRCEELLTVDELRLLTLDADLVVLNACASGILSQGSGKTRHLMPEIVIRAGAKNALTTLWNVTDRYAAGFMIRFYQLLLKGMSYSSALRETKLQMIRCAETSLPTLWAPYVITQR